MASIGHVAVGMAAARAYDPVRGPRWPSMALWSALSLAPDVDVAGFLHGVPYGAPWGHRGATHSLTAALVGAIAVALGARWRGRPFGRTLLFASGVLASHGLLDAMTDGGLGVALLWPFSLTRYFASWRPIVVAPIGLDFFTPYGAVVAATEVVLFAPLLAYALWPRRSALRPGLAVAAAGIWLTAAWLVASADPIRDRVIAVALQDRTRFATGYSEHLFRAIAIGDAESAVRARMGEPLDESLFFMPRGSRFESAMDVSVANLPPGCFGVHLRAGVVQSLMPSDICNSRGIREGISRENVQRALGAPSESCAEYSENAGTGHFRLRMVCFLHGKVEAVLRRWM